MRLPSGAHAGQQSMAGLFVSRLTLPPSRSMTWISRLPLRLLAKASNLPSGDQLGLLSRATSLVSRLTFLPSVSARYSSWLPSRVLTHTSDLPSGAHRGDSSKAACGMRFLLSEPSALTVLI